jgi:hypothetical protein
VADPVTNEAAALTIYECPECGSLDSSATRCESLPSHDRRRARATVFREEERDRLLRLLHGAHAEMTDGPPVPFDRWLADGGDAAVPEEARELREAYDVHTERMDLAEQRPTWEDVRPLWEAARSALPDQDQFSREGIPRLGGAFDAFPAPEEWTR